MFAYLDFGAQRLGLERPSVMGILNVTPDSFSGDGLIDAAGDPVRTAVARGQEMVADGADVLDVGGESSRPGHASVSAADELARIVPVIRALRAAMPDIPISVDTTKPAVADAAIEAGAHMLNDVWGVSPDGGLARVAAVHSVPLVVMHNRAEARYMNLVPEILADLQRALERALAAGVAWEHLIVDPGFGFGKAPPHNLALLRGLASFRLLGRPILLGTSRKSTLGKVLDLPADERVEATLARLFEPFFTTRAARGGTKKYEEGRRDGSRAGYCTGDADGGAANARPAGTMAVRSGSARFTPAAFSAVLRERCFLVMNMVFGSQWAAAAAPGFLIFIWNASLETTPSTSDENR